MEVIEIERTDCKEGPSVIEIETENFKIKVSSVGTLDMEKFIVLAMSLPSFYK